MEVVRLPLKKTSSFSEEASPTKETAAILCICSTAPLSLGA